jgi:hypothetical protein
MRAPYLHILRRARIRSASRAVVNAIVNTAIFLLLAVVGGVTSSLSMVDKGSTLTTRISGPWVTWIASGRPDADPYTRAHFARQGGIPESSTVTQTWQARTDADGQTLHSACEYVIEGEALEAGWWSMAIYDERGWLIQNAAERHAYNAQTIALDQNGGYVVTLARDARPGNWLPTGGAGRLALVLTRPALKPGASSADIAASLKTLPSIRRVTCR